MTPFDLPLPEYEVAVPVGLMNGVPSLHFAAAIKAVKDAGRLGSSVLFRLPEGPNVLPEKNSDPAWYVNWASLGSTENTHMVLAGAKNGTSEVTGGPTRPQLMALNSYCVGLWRVRDVAVRDMMNVFSFGTGGYNNKKHVMVLQNLKARYIKGRLLMAAYELGGGADLVNQPGVDAVINDELWMEEVDSRYSDGSHMLYVDQRAKFVARRCTFAAGGAHTLKTAALDNDWEDVTVSNVDPDTGLTHVIGAGVSSVFPSGNAFYGDSAPISSIALSRIHARRVKVLKVWETPYADGGSYAVTRQARWDLGRVNPELVNPTSRDYWLAARAAGIDNPKNPYLAPMSSFWENCRFENRMPAGKTGARYVIGNQSSHPTLYEQGRYSPVEPNFPDLWFERSRDYMLECETVGFAGPWKFTDPWAASFPEAEARLASNEPLVYQSVATKTDWWPSASLEPDVTAPQVPQLFGQPAQWSQ